MIYEEYLATASDCPFCGIPESWIIERGTTMSVINNRAPYMRDHIMIISHRHIMALFDMTLSEREELAFLQERYARIFSDMGYHGSVHLLRDGSIADGMGKSIDHFHYHIIPEYYIPGPRDRTFVSDEEYMDMTHDFRERVKRIRLDYR